MTTTKRPYARHWTHCSLVVLLFFYGAGAQARKFSFKTEDIAAFFRATGGLSTLGQRAFADSISSSTVSFSDQTPALNLGGELGFLMKVSEQWNLRLSAEVLQSKVAGVTGSSPTGSDDYFDLESDVFVFNPQAVVEYTFRGTPTSRFVSYFGLGYASVRLDNRFEMTNAGEVNLGVSSYTEKSEGSFISGVTGIGWEGLFVDNVTAFVDVGYRFLDVNKLKHKADQLGIGGQISKGAQVQNADGKTRTFDLGGPFFGIAFRFYIDVI